MILAYRIKSSIHYDIMRIQHQIKEFFSFTASEKNGLLVLLIILLGIYLSPMLFLQSDKEGEVFNLQKQQQIDSLIAQIERKKEPAPNKFSEIKLCVFDPNTANRQQLDSLGFSDFQIINLLKYREKGGRFRDKRDLLKIYGFSESDFTRLDSFICIAPYIQHEEQKITSIPVSYHLFSFDPNCLSDQGWDSLGVEPKIYKRIQKYIASGARFDCPMDLRKVYGFSSEKLKELMPYVRIAPHLTNRIIANEFQIVDLNCLDTTVLKSLPGIGTILSRRIVKYGKLLGGYVVKEQLFEVYGLSEEIFNRIAPLIAVDSTSIERICINKARFENLRKHPYVSFRMAQDIVRYRDRKGEFSSIEELNRLQIVPDSVFMKLKPYLILN